MLRALQQLGTRLTSWTIRWVPDAWVVAVLLTVLVWCLAVWLGGVSWWIGPEPLSACAAKKS